MSTFREIFLVEQKKNVLILTPKGDTAGFYDHDVEDQAKALFEQVDEPKVKHILIDFSHASYFGSLIIGLVIRLEKQISEKGGKLVLAEVSEPMQHMLDSMKLQDKLPSFVNRKLALKELKKQPQL